MAVSVVVRLREGRYDAGALNPGQAEWPPHPARLFCALVAACKDDDERKTLLWLETASPPEVWAPGLLSVGRSRGWMVTNATEPRGGHQIWPGRKNVWSQRSCALPDDDTWAMIWPDAEPDDSHLARLVRLGSRVGYVGRSTSTVELSVHAEAVRPRPSWIPYEPVPLGRRDGCELRVPVPGYLDALAEAYQSGVPAWQVNAPTRTYAPRTTEAPVVAGPEVATSPYADLLIFGFRRPMVSIGGDNVLTVTEALRRAVMSRVGDPIPQQVSGHGADNRPHVAFLGLVDVGHRYADGHLLGVGIGVPEDLPAGDRRRLLIGLLGPNASRSMDQLHLGRMGTVPLVYQPRGGSGLSPERWQGDAGCRRWVTATPLMLDRYPKNPNRLGDVAEVVAAAVVTAGYPTPIEVEPLPGPVIEGAPYRYRPGTLKDRPKRPTYHCRIVFDRPVQGPVVAGALRYLGGGLMVPERAAP